MKHKTWINLIVVLGLLVSSGILNLTTLPTARAEINAVTILYVEYAASGDCSSWEEACSLNKAVNTAVSGTEIWVPAGTYNLSGGGRERELQMKNGVAIYGGFDGTETSRDQRDPDPATNGTIISGDIGVAGVDSDNRYHVVTASGTDSTAILDGFTITGGYANGTYPFNSGGGMYTNGGSPTLTNLILSDNSAAGSGGGMYNVENSSPLLANVTFSGNSANSHGGGMYNNNSSPTLTNVTFSGNSADGGGGMYNNNSSLTLANVIISGNSAGNGGGMVNSDSSLTLTNVTFSGNSVTSWPNVGGGMYNSNSSLSLRNSILWGNTASSGAQISNNSSTPLISHTLIQGSGGSASWDTNLGIDGGGNIDADPQFIEPVDPAEAPTTGGDLRLGAGSPAIDAGDNQYVTGITTDLDGNLRISGGTVDMGAYEYQFFYILTVSLAGSGDGSVSSAPAGIDCGSDCTASYADGTIVTLTASADTGSSFSGWSGACTNTSVDCVVTMSEAKSVTATFTLNQYLLSVSLAGDGNGSVTSDPTGIDCGTDCSESYDYGTLVTLTASADTGSSFSGWSGAGCSGSGDCTVTMNAPREVTATFEAEQLPIPPTGRFELFLPLTQRNH